MALFCVGWVRYWSTTLLQGATEGHVVDKSLVWSERTPKKQPKVFSTKKSLQTIQTQDLIQNIGIYFIKAFRCITSKVYFVFFFFFFGLQSLELSALTLAQFVPFISDWRFTSPKKKYLGWFTSCFSRMALFTEGAGFDFWSAAKCDYCVLSCRHEQINVRFYRMFLMSFSTEQCLKCPLAMHNVS